MAVKKIIYLQAKLEGIPRYELKIMIGDMNAEVGNENKSYECVMGMEGCCSMNGNREKLL